MDTIEKHELDAAVSATRALTAHVFELAAARRWRDLAELVHPAAELAVGTEHGARRRLRGAAVRRWLLRADHGEREYQLEPRVTSIEVLDSNVALATGTLRAPLPGRGHVLTHATWILVFRDGLVYRADRRPTLSEARALARTYTREASQHLPPTERAPEG